jgi:energy-coupling factor transporter ATP-binding protein EcfA2
MTRQLPDPFHNPGRRGGTTERAAACQDRPTPTPQHPWAGTLVVLRGNSGSGKSTVARALQLHYDHAQTALIAQDNIRRTILREPDIAHAFNIDLLELMATTCLTAGRLVVVEGILDADRYGPALQRIAGHARRALFYAWDLTFSETVHRHAQRPQATEFGIEDMRSWYHGWQPLPFTTETRIDATWNLDTTINHILADLATQPGPLADAPLPLEGLRNSSENTLAVARPQ